MTRFPYGNLTASNRVISSAGFRRDRGPPGPGPPGPVSPLRWAPKPRRGSLSVRYCKRLRTTLVASQTERYLTGAAPPHGRPVSTICVVPDRAQRYRCPDLLDLGDHLDGICGG